MRDSVAVVHELVAALSPFDALEAGHITGTLRWLESTDDVFRRAKPATPPRHLVSYAAVLDPHTFDVLLVDHLNARPFLPPGGHVEPEEHPAAAARRECREELGIDSPIALGAGNPTFLTVTTTIGRDTDVSLWFIIEGSRDMQLTIDEVEFRGVRWWSLPEVTSADGKAFDPHFQRFMRKAVASLEVPLPLHSDPQGQR
jgi:8-oxo-dGTP pyrophosphatase MutT (NUDIX family)